MTYLKIFCFLMFLIISAHSGFEKHGWIFVENFGSSITNVGKQLDEIHEELAEREKKLKDLLVQNDSGRNLVLASISFACGNPENPEVDSFHIGLNDRPLVFESNNNGSKFAKCKINKGMFIDGKCIAIKGLQDYLLNCLNPYEFLPDNFPIMKHIHYILQVAKNSDPLVQIRLGQTSTLKAFIDKLIDALTNEKLIDALNNERGRMNELAEAMQTAQEKISEFQNNIEKIVPALTDTSNANPPFHEIEDIFHLTPKEKGENLENRQGKRGKNAIKNQATSSAVSPEGHSASMEASQQFMGKGKQGKKGKTVIKNQATSSEVSPRAVYLCKSTTTSYGKGQT